MTSGRWESSQCQKERPLSVPANQRLKRRTKNTAAQPAFGKVSKLTCNEEVVSVAIKLFFINSSYTKPSYRFKSLAVSHHGPSRYSRGLVAVDKGLKLSCISFIISVFIFCLNFSCKCSQRYVWFISNTLQIDTSLWSSKTLDSPTLELNFAALVLLYTQT